VQVEGRTSRWTWVAVLLAAVVATGLVGARIHAQPIQPYGSNGAAWIEHAVRLQVRDAVTCCGGGPLRILQRADDAVISHPPGLHLFTTLVGEVTGHRAEAVLWTGPAWLLLLAFGVAVCARRVSGRGDVAAFAAVGTLAVPALQGAATRYHYDLPMSALLWLATAVLLLARDRRRARDARLLAAAAGGLLVAAALVKWTALPYGLLMLAAAMVASPSEDRAESMRRLRLLALACASAAALTLTWLVVARTSFSSAWLAVGSGEPWTISARLDPARLFWYPAALVRSVLSQSGAVLVVAGLVVWLARSRKGWPFVALIVGGQWLFCVTVVGPLDERFVLTLVPALVLATGLGWGTLPVPWRRGTAAVAAALALVIGLDFHFGGLDLGPQSSFEQRGWARGEDVAPAELELREALWGALGDCIDRKVGLVEGVSEEGDVWWLRYRGELAGAWGQPGADAVVVRPDGRGWRLDRDAVDDPDQVVESGISLEPTVAIVRLPERDGSRPLHMRTLAVVGETSDGRTLAVVGRCGAEELRP
jgi:hypothetical protein